MKTKSIRRIKESVTEVEFKKLMAYTRGNEIIRTNTKSNLLKAFTILYYTGLRLNEVQELRIKDIKELLSSGTVKIVLSKTLSERKLYLSDSFAKELRKLFDFNIEEDENRVIAKGNSKSKKTGINHIVFIQQVNKFMQEVLGNGFTSHSFRQGLITEMGSKSVNPKIIQRYIGHRDLKTTMNYINPTDEDIQNSLVR